MDSGDTIRLQEGYQRVDLDIAAAENEYLGAYVILQRLDASSGHEHLLIIQGLDGNNPSARIKDANGGELNFESDHDLGNFERLGASGGRLANLKNYLSDVRSDANRLGEYAPDYYRFDLKLDGLSTTLNLDFDTSLAGILELSGGFDLNLFAEGGIGFAFDANAPDLGSTFLLDSAAGTGQALGDLLPKDMGRLLGVDVEGAPELVVGASLESTQDLVGRLGFLELAASSSDNNVLGVGSAAEAIGGRPIPEWSAFAWAGSFGSGQWTSTTDRFRSALAQF